jgi:hypothetical protein
MPRMLADMIGSAAASAGDVAVVGDVDAADAADVLRVMQTDVVVIGRDEAQLVSGLLAIRPSLKVLAVIDDGRDAALYELRPHKRAVGELSPDRLMALVRAART